MQGEKDDSVVTKITLSISFPNEKEAEDAACALKVDDDEYVITTVEGSVVRGEVEASSVEGARRAADDWLACLMSVVKKE
jgi:hypothetical protein